MSTIGHEGDEVKHYSEPNLVWRLEEILFWLDRYHVQATFQQMSSEVNHDEGGSIGGQELVAYVQ